MTCASRPVMILYALVVFDCSSARLPSRTEEEIAYLYPRAGPATNMARVVDYLAFEAMYHCSSASHLYSNRYLYKHQTG